MERKTKNLTVQGNITVHFEDNTVAKAAFQSIKNEGYTSKRCIAETELKSKDIDISIKADDIVSFRATANGFLRALQVIESVEKIHEVDKI